jgi:hypothetical protein
MAGMCRAQQIMRISGVVVENNLSFFDRYCVEGDRQVTNNFSLFSSYVFLRTAVLRRFIPTSNCEWVAGVQNSAAARHGLCRWFVCSFVLLSIRARLFVLLSSLFNPNCVSTNYRKTFVTNSGLQTPLVNAENQLKQQASHDIVLATIINRDRTNYRAWQIFAIAESELARIVDADNVNLARASVCFVCLFAGLLVFSSLLDVLIGSVCEVERFDRLGRE